MQMTKKKNKQKKGKKQSNSKKHLQSKSWGAAKKVKNAKGK
jgi:hypothetical protein